MDKPNQPSNNSSQPASWVDLSYQEVVDHISWIRDPEVEDDTQIYYIGLVDSTFPGSFPDDLIFHPNHWFKDESMLHAELSDEMIVQYLMSWTGKRLVGAEAIDLPAIPDSKSKDPPAIILL